MFLNFADPSGRDSPVDCSLRSRTCILAQPHLTVTRTATNQWVIEAGDSDIAELVSVPTTNGKVVKVNEGYYTMPFRITVTK